MNYINFSPRTNGASFRKTGIDIFKKNNLPNVWDYLKMPKFCKKFWKSGIERSKNWEKLVTVGMRGDDEAMGEGTNIALWKI
jgi:hypothetical protein